MGKNNFDFSNDWTEIQPEVEWPWIMWQEVGDEVIGWIVEIRKEEFSDKQTGEVRENDVCYMIKENGEAVRFIMPTDLRNKINTLENKREKAKLKREDILVKITFTGTTQTSKGYKIKTFKVAAKKSKMPKRIASNIPELPSTFSEDFEEIDPEQIGF